MDADPLLEQKLLQLEEQLLDPNVRKSIDGLTPCWLTNLGSPGRVFKNQTIASLKEESPVQRSIADFKMVQLAPDAALATCRIRAHESSDSKMRHTLRSSIWKRIDERWQMFFHQGTLTRMGGYEKQVKTPRQVIEEWVAAFNARDAGRAAALYHEDATNWQVAAGPPVVGQARIAQDLTAFFAAFPDSVTHVENLFEAGEWAILEWSGGGTWKGNFADMAPNGRSFTLRGCGFFHIVDGKIEYQRGYWDRTTWFKQLGIPV